MAHLPRLERGHYGFGVRCAATRARDACYVLDTKARVQRAQSNSLGISSGDRKAFFVSCIHVILENNLFVNPSFISTLVTNAGRLDGYEVYQVLLLLSF